MLELIDSDDEEDVVARLQFSTAMAKNPSDRNRSPMR